MPGMGMGIPRPARGTVSREKGRLAVCLWAKSEEGVGSEKGGEAKVDLRGGRPAEPGRGGPPGMPKGGGGMPPTKHDVA